MRDVIDARIREVFVFQDPRLPSHLQEPGKPFKKLDSPVYRICLEAVCSSNDPRTFLEIGVKRGGSLQVVIDHAPNLRRAVLADFWSINDKKCSEKEHVIGLLAEATGRGRRIEASFLDGSSLETLKEVSETFQLIGVDGSHRRDVFSHDLQQAVRLCEIGGFIVVDDLVLHDDQKLDEELIRFVSNHLHDVELVYRNTRQWPGAAILRRRSSAPSVLESVAAAIRIGATKQQFVGSNLHWTPQQITSAVERYIDRQDWQALDYLIHLMHTAPAPEFVPAALSILKRESLEIDNLRIVKTLRELGLSQAQINEQTGLRKIVNGLTWSQTNDSTSVLRLV